MRILLDTNFLYSALFHPTQRFDAILEFVFSRNEPLILEYVADELIRKAKAKRPESINSVYGFLELINLWPDDYSRSHESKPQMRDPKDQPILDAAVRYDVDIVISGDKHFLQLEIDRPQILSPTQFIAEYLPNLV